MDGGTVWCTVVQQSMYNACTMKTSSESGIVGGLVSLVEWASRRNSGNASLSVGFGPKLNCAGFLDCGINASL